MNQAPFNLFLEMVRINNLPSLAFIESQMERDKRGTAGFQIGSGHTAIYSPNGERGGNLNLFTLEPDEGVYLYLNEHGDVCGVDLMLDGNSNVETIITPETTADVETIVKWIDGFGIAIGWQPETPFYE